MITSIGRRAAPSSSQPSKEGHAADDPPVTAALPPLHSGEVLREEFMAPHTMSAGAVAKACRVPRTRTERMVREEVGITADTALRLEKLFGATAAFWLGLQADDDVETTRRAIGAEIAAIQLMVA